MAGEECKAALYRKIIERYKQVIEEGEAKSVPELKERVQPKNASVQKLREQISSEFHPYISERDFEAAALKAFAFVRDEIANEPLPVEFWLSIEEILDLKGADEMDKATLLCSLLVALENNSAKVVVASEGADRHAFVLYEFKGFHHLLDPFHGVTLSGSKKEVIEKFFEGKQQGKLYEFNHETYEEW